MNLSMLLKEKILILDGGMGTLLQSRGLMPGELPERWNLTRPEVITDIHRAYYEAGSNIVSTNTFGANALKFLESELEEIVAAAVKNARMAAEGVEGRFVALDIGPSGRVLKPYGDLDFEDAVELFAKTVRLGVKYGVDLIFIETMNDIYETKAALFAAKENSDLPVFVSNAYGEDGKLMTGADPGAVIAMLEGMGADVIGVNCSLGPRALAPVVREYLALSSTPVLIKPNAGMPRVEGGVTVYDVSPSEFASECRELAALGVSAVGGCCGTTPEYISEVVRALSDVKPTPVTDKGLSLVGSYTHAVRFGESPILIGERINPTGKKRFKQALMERDIAYILGEGIAEEEHGSHILDVNVGLPEVDEPIMLTEVIRELQAVTDLPLQIDTSDPLAMEAALRIYNGKAMINSVNGKQESMDAVFPLAKKYGGVIVALTLDEGGIPSDAEGRLRIAERIVAEAERYGISKKDIIFDPLALTVSADKDAARETLLAVELISTRLGCHTSLGVSNVSFGLPERSMLNSTFFALALSRGLSAAIVNPLSEDMMRTYYSYRALMGLDGDFSDYIGFADKGGAKPKAEEKGEDITLGYAIEKGLKLRSAELTRELISGRDPLSVINEEVIPALDRVGVGFEEKRVYLPQLLMSAEAAKAAFEVVKTEMHGSVGVGEPIVIATVKGDIHDIGKNIVGLLLENYGFRVTDLGKDVSPEKILATARDTGARVVALSALMTTTVPAMQQTVELMHRELPECKVIVGGAVLTEEYAREIGADGYAKDAMGAVRLASEIVRA